MRPEHEPDLRMLPTDLQTSLITTSPKITPFTHMMGVVVVPSTLLRLPPLVNLPAIRHSLSVSLHTFGIRGGSEG